MKTIIATLALATLALGAFAQGVGFSVYASTGTAINKGTNYVVISPASKNGGEPVVTYLNMNALADSGTVTLTSYVSTNQVVCIGTNSTTSLHVGSTNGFVAGNWVVIEHPRISNLRFRNEAAIIASVGLTNITLATAPVNTTYPGDTVNFEVASGSIPLASSATAREISGAGIVSGQRNEPFLLTLVGSAASTNTINAACATYVP